MMMERFIYSCFYLPPSRWVRIPSTRNTLKNNGYLSIICVLLLCSAAVVVQADEHEVIGIDNRNYQSMFFEPDFLQIEPGDSVTFVVTHFDHLPRSVFVPDGATHWEADPGMSITVTFSEEGIYIFECLYHAVMGMTGVVLVGHPVNLEEARTFFEHYKDMTFAMNGNRLDRLWHSGHSGDSLLNSHSPKRLSPTN